jgi:pilus assembly protein CpaE
VRNSKVLVLDVTEDLGDQVTRVTSSLRPRPEVVICDSLADVAPLIRERGPFDVLIAGSMVSHETGLRQVRSFGEHHPHMKLILAFDHWRGSNMRDVVRTGAVDVLRLPVEDETLLDAVEQAIVNGHPMSAAEQDHPSDQKGTVTVAVSATGGCGKTFLATNFAYHLQHQGQGRSCLLDLDLQFGELSTALRLKPKYTIADLLAHDADNEALEARLEEYLALHDTGVHLLAAPDEPAQADAIDADDVARVIEAAQARFENVVIDTSTALSDAMLVAIDHADQIFVMATLDLPSVRNLGLLLSTFQQLKVPPERIKLVMNKVEPDVGIDVEGVAKYFPQGFSMVIPYGREVHRSLNLGQPVLAYAPRTDVSKALIAGLAGNITTVGAGPPAHHRWLGRRRKHPA